MHGEVGVGKTMILNFFMKTSIIQRRGFTSMNL